MKEKIEIPNITFKNKKGNNIKLSDIINKNDYWKARKGEALIISHKGVEKIAKEAGIKPQINTRFHLEVEPSYGNGMNHQVRAEMKCEAYINESSKICHHGTDLEFFSTGEASRFNTGARGGGYLRIMAEKRAYDRGILKHLGIESDINIYSEDEAEAFEKEEQKPIDEIIIRNKNFIQKILNCKTKQDFIKVSKELKQLNISNNERNYLRKVGNQRYIELFGTF